MASVCTISSKESRCSRSRAFTLIEMLVVISLIVLLIALLQPALQSAKESARDVECRTQLRSIMQAFEMFSDDHVGTMPASWYEGPEPWQKAWAGSEVGTRGTTGVFEGTLTAYLNGPSGARATYRCPSLNRGTWGTGVGSNGRFDYSSFTSFSGAKKVRVPLDAEWTDPSTGVISRAITPVVIEEDPLHHINACCIEAGHGSTDEQGTWHNRGSNYAAIDGSAHRQVFTAAGPNCYDWKAVAPSGVITTLHDGPFGAWNSR